MIIPNYHLAFFICVFSNLSDFHPFQYSRWCSWTSKCFVDIWCSEPKVWTLGERLSWPLWKVSGFLGRSGNLPDLLSLIHTLNLDLKSKPALGQHISPFWIIWFELYWTICLACESFKSYLPSKHSESCESSRFQPSQPWSSTSSFVVNFASPIGLQVLVSCCSFWFTTLYHVFIFSSSLIFAFSITLLLTFLEFLISILFFFLVFQPYKLLFILFFLLRITWSCLESYSLSHSWLCLFLNYFALFEGENPIDLQSYFSIF